MTKNSYENMQVSKNVTKQPSNLWKQIYALLRRGLLWNLSTCQTCRIDLKTTKKKHDDCTDSLDLFITDNGKLSGESALVSARDWCGEREREKRIEIDLSVQCSRTRVRLVQRSLWRYTTRSVSDGFCCLTQTRWDSAWCTRRRRKQKIEIHPWKSS